MNIKRSYKQASKILSTKMRRNWGGIKDADLFLINELLDALYNDWLLTQQAQKDITRGFSEEDIKDFETMNNLPLVKIEEVEG